MAYGHADRWADSLPKRWRRNGAIFGVIYQLWFFVTELDHAAILDAGFWVEWLIKLAVQLALAAALFGLIFWLAGRLARWSLPLTSEDWDLIIRRVRRNWRLGSAILATVLAVSIEALDSLSTEAIGGSFILFGGTLLVGFIVDLVSRRGLKSAIEDDLSG